MPINDQLRDSASPAELATHAKTVEASREPFSVLTINGGSSSIRFALYETGESLAAAADGKVDRIGLSGTNLAVNGLRREDQQDAHRSTAADHRSAVRFLLDWLEAQPVFASVNAVGHRVVHGMTHYANRSGSRRSCSMNCTASRRMPRSICRGDRVDRGFPRSVPSCPRWRALTPRFTAPCRGSPVCCRFRDATRRRAFDRYGFHGLSYEYLMEELARLGDPAATKGRVILAHLGNGASLAAVRDGKSIDTSMGFTPTAGLVMSTRSGDLDPGLVYLPGAHRANERDAVSGNGEPRVRAARSFGDQFRPARLARAGSRRRSRGGSRGAVLLSGEEVDRLLRRGARRLGHARLRRRHRRKRATHPHSASAKDSASSASN